MNNEDLIYDVLGQDAFIMVNKKLLKHIKDLNAAVLLGDLISKAKYFRSKGQLINGWFFNTQSNVQEDTGLSDYQWRKALLLLESLELVNTKNKGVPMTKHYKINYDLIASILTSSATTDLRLKDVKHTSVGTTDLSLEELKGNNTHLTTATNNIHLNKISNDNQLVDVHQTSTNVETFGELRQSTDRIKSSQFLDEESAMEFNRMLANI
jgi:hypothetical protein